MQLKADVIHATWKIINRRYKGLLPTVITTNFSWDDVLEGFGEPIAYRLLQLYQWVQVGGANLHADE